VLKKEISYIQLSFHTFIVFSASVLPKGLAYYLLDLLSVCFGSKADIRFYPQEPHNYHIKYMCCLNATYYLERVTAFDPKQIFRL